MMKPRSRSPHSGRPPKRKRTDAELQDLARALGADWTRGDTVQIWIHKHEGKTGELSRMVEAGWLWEDIGKAMHLAGITYSTGQQIPSHTLRLKAYLARNRERDRIAAEAARQGQFPTVTLVPTAATGAAAAVEAPVRLVAPATPLGMSEAAGRRPPGQSTFQLVTLKGGQQPPAPKPLSRNLTQEPSATTTVSDEDILRRVFGKS
jgi:hypothetical protein